MRLKHLLAGAALAVSGTAQAISPFSLPWMNADGGQATYSTSSYSNGVFVIEGYQLRCAPCQQNASNIDALARFFSYEPRVQIIDLGLDTTRRDFDQWIAQHRPSYPVLMDQGRQVWSQLRGQGTPTTWILDCHLNVKWSHVGVWESDTRAEAQRVIDELLDQDCAS